MSAVRGLALVILLATCALAQGADARASLVTTTIAPEVVTIGEPFVVRVRVRAPKVATIRFPPVPDSGGPVEAVDPRAIEEGAPGDLLDRTAIYRFVAWKPGMHQAALGPVVVTVAGQERAFAVGPQEIAVRSLLPPDSTQRVPKEARDPLTLANALWKLWIALAVLAVLLLWYWVARRRRGTHAGRELEPFEAAQAGFASLDALALADVGEPGRHVIAHVDVMRSYLARRFPAATPALSAGETVVTLAKSEFPILPERVGEILERDEGVRYARHSIAQDAAVALARDARGVVLDVQSAHEARLRALDRGAPRRRRK